MITLEKLQMFTRERFKGEPLSVVHYLVTWGTLEGPNNELERYLHNSGIDLDKFIETLTPLLKNADARDRELVTICFKTVTDEKIKGIHLIQTICDTPDHRLTRALIEKGMKCKIVIDNIQAIQKPQTTLSNLGISADAKADPLKKFGRDLTALAAEGAFDKLCPQPEVTIKLKKVLLRRSKANAILTGDPGVGKTGSVENLAKAIVHHSEVSLSNFRIFEISMGEMVADTKYRGQFEERFEKMMKAVIECSPCILFIDEIHKLIGSGSAEGTTIDGANLMKPYLVRDDFRVIGATTHDEYQHIVKDGALARRFQEIKIEEPDEQTLKSILQYQAKSLSRHHGVKIGNIIIEETIKLTNQYIGNRCQPDKSIDLLDTASVTVLMDGRNTMDVNDLHNTLSEMMGISLRILSKKDRDIFKDIEENIKKIVVGQNRAIKDVVSVLAQRSIGIGKPDRPLAVLLFAGGSGQGKTTLAKATATTYFGDEKRLFHLDMAEYSGDGSENKLIGSPPGYTRSDEDGILIKSLNAYPSSVILFDEIEKADPDVHNLLLGLLDNGRIANNRGRKIDAKQCIIIMTTNALSPEDIEKKPMGFGTNSIHCANPIELLGKDFPKEFLERIDKIILFNRLNKSDMQKIMKMRLDETLERLSEEGINLVFDEKRLLNYLLDGLESTQSGARGIDRLLERRFLQPLSIALLKQDLKGERVVELTDDYYVHGKFKFLS